MIYRKQVQLDCHDFIVCNILLTLFPSHKQQV